MAEYLEDEDLPNIELTDKQPQVLVFSGHLADYNTHTHTKWPDPVKLSLMQQVCVCVCVRVLYNNQTYHTAITRLIQQPPFSNSNHKLQLVSYTDIAPISYRNSGSPTTVTHLLEQSYDRYQALLW